MKRVRYERYSGDLASEVDLEDLLQALSDYFLDSGFDDPYSRFQDLDHDMESLREALRRILESGELFDGAMQAKVDQLAAEGKLDELIDKLIKMLAQQRYISYEQNADGNGYVDSPESPVDDARFEVTDKSLDFLGYKTLRDLLGSLGKSSYGRHDTRHWATGIEASGGSRRYEFGDVLNLDATATLGAAIAREVA